MLRAAIIILIGVAAVLIGAGLAWRAIRQNAIARSQVIRTPNGIEEALYVRLGGIDQWVQIRGEDRANPVLLVLHGGMATSYVPLTPKFQAWEKDFTVVQWDRRGVAKTFARNGASGSGEMRLDRIAGDGIELSEWLRGHLGKRKIILMGHSMGSQIGVTMAARRPDLFHAYVATEQIVDMASNEEVSYRLILEGLRRHGTAKDVARLEKLGPPPYARLMDWGAKQALAETADPLYGATFKREVGPMLLYSPAWTLGDLLAFVRGNMFSGKSLYRQWMAFDARGLGDRFSVPIVVIQGESDVMTPTPLVRAWCDGLQAPSKQIALIPGGGHLTMFTRPDEFLAALETEVRPLAIEGEQ
jgi:pimeloyl-ACP methyl ester carboxylesterase